MTSDMLAVASQSGETVEFFELDRYRHLGSVMVPPEPHEVLLDPARRLLYVSHTYRSGHYLDHTGHAQQLSIIDVDSRQIVDILDLAPERAPHGLHLDAGRDLLYVSVEAGPAGPGGLLVLDASRRKVVGRIDAEADQPHWFAVTPDGATAYTANKRAAYISVLDLGNGTIVNRIPVPGTEEITATPDGRYVYAAAPAIDPATAAEAGGRILVIDTTTHRVINTIATALPVSPLHVTTGGTLLAGQWRHTIGTDGEFTPLDGVLNTYDTDDWTLTGTTDTQRLPINIRSDPSGRRAFVSNLNSGTVSVVELPSMRTLTVLTVDRSGRTTGKRYGQGAHGLTFISR
ncbi:YncE family protein [Actinoplanes lobatus]|nr:YncE family protein [Actinoplanes lobatus]MBB4751962.1 DNA-binding beta-propeller fold protein YncE [Actinoplanes lobatus]